MFVYVVECYWCEDLGDWVVISVWIFVDLLVIDDLCVEVWQVVFFCVQVLIEQFIVVCLVDYWFDDWVCVIVWIYCVLELVGWGDLVSVVDCLVCQVVFYGLCFEVQVEVDGCVVFYNCYCVIWDYCECVCV